MEIVFGFIAAWLLWDMTFGYNGLKQTRKRNQMWDERFEQLRKERQDRIKNAPYNETLSKENYGNANR